MGPSSLAQGNSGGYAYYHTCNTATSSVCMSEGFADGICMNYKQYARSGCSAWGTPTIEEHQDTCTPSNDGITKVECTLE